MGRKPRVFVAGAVYHVYNRISSGEPVFRDEKPAREFVEELRGVARRDGWRVFAWCLMSNHYHVVVRAGDVPLWRGLHRLQNVFSRRYNRRHGRTGPLWQSRYRAKLILDEGHLWHVILYVHLNPVRAGMVEDPAEYGYSGHMALLGKRGWGIVDVDGSLLCFGETRRLALRHYRAAAKASIREELGAVAGEDEAEQRGDGEGVWYDPEVPYVDELGRSSGMERPEVTVVEFLKAASEVLGIEYGLLTGRSRAREVARARRMVAALGVERWGFRGRELARVLGRSPDVMSWMVGRAVRERVEDEAFAKEMDLLDGEMTIHLGSGAGT